MNVVVLVSVAAVGICALWVAQTVALIYVGERLALPLQYTTRSPVVRMTSQVMIQAVWIIIVVGTPIALGINPLDALQRAFPLPVPWRRITTAFLIMSIPLCLGYALYIQGAMAALRAEARRRDPAKEAVFAVFDAGAFGCA